MEDLIVGKQEIQELKEQYVKNKFTDYLYHKHAIDVIQEQLDRINDEINDGGIVSGIKEFRGYTGAQMSPYQLELIGQEGILVKEQDDHIKCVEMVDSWLGTISNKSHRKTIYTYLIENRCTEAIATGEQTGYTNANVVKVCKKYIKRFSRDIM